MTLPLNEIRRKGLAAIEKELGKAGMIRFLQQFETGSGDYGAKARLGQCNVLRRHSGRDRVAKEEAIRDWRVTNRGHLVSEYAARVPK